MLSSSSLSDCRVCTSTGLCDALADRPVERGRGGRVAGIDRLGFLVAGEHLFVAPGEQDEVCLGAA